MKLQAGGEIFMISYFREYLPTTASDFVQISRKKEITLLILFKIGGD